MIFVYFGHLLGKTRTLYPYNMGYPLSTWHFSLILHDHRNNINIYHHENIPLKSLTPLKPHFYIVKLWFYRGIHYFSFFCSKHRLWVLVRTYVLNRSMKNISLFSRSMKNIRVFLSEVWKISVFLSENFQFLDVKFSVYLNTRVHVMGTTLLVSSSFFFFFFFFFFYRVSSFLSREWFYGRLILCNGWTLWNRMVSWSGADPVPREGSQFARTSPKTGRSPGRPTEIGLQLGKACYPCSRYGQKGNVFISSVSSRSFLFLFLSCPSLLPPLLYFLSLFLRDNKNDPQGLTCR